MVITKTLFNKSYKEMSTEEKAVYRSTVPSSHRDIIDAWRFSFCYQYFGKRYKDLNKVELQEYNALMSKRSGKVFKVKVIETLEKEIVVRAKSEEDALHKVKHKYLNEKIELVPEDLVDVDYKIVKKVR